MFFLLSHCLYEHKQQTNFTVLCLDKRLGKSVCDVVVNGGGDIVDTGCGEHFWLMLS